MEQKVNNNPVPAFIQSAAAPGAPVPGAVAPARRQTGRKARRGPDGQGGRGPEARAQGEATRLLARLAVPGAFLGPSADGRDAWSIGVTGARRLAGGGGVSLAGGVVSGETVRELLSAGVLEQVAGAARQRLALSGAGHARLRRAEAAGASSDARSANPAANPSVNASANPWLAQHADLADGERRVDGEMRRVCINHAESPLAWLRRRRDRSGAAMIDEIAFAAGERLRADMTRARMTPRVTASWEPAASAGNGARLRQEPGDMALAARQRVARALAAAGDEFAGVLVDVCGFLKGLEQVEQERGWPARSGKLILRMALARLAAHYGLSAVQGPERARTRAWRGQDNVRSC